MELMTAATVTEISVMDLPSNIVSGTAQKRRKLIAIRYTTAALSDTITLTTYVPQVADIEGVMWDTMSSAVTGTSATWSTATITTAGFYGGGSSGEIGVIVNIT